MKVRDFCRVRYDGVEWYEFRFGSGLDFAAALERFKSLVPFTERQYVAGKHCWRVKVAYADQEKIATALAAIFENWTDCVEMVTRQMFLPGFA